MEDTATAGAVLTAQERAAIAQGRWFASLSPTLRHDILRLGRVRRCVDGEQICTRGEPASAWLAMARGTARVSFTSRGGKQVTLCYAEPGNWLGDAAVVDGGPHTHDVHAQGSTTLFMLPGAQVQAILELHPEFALALLRLQARRMRQLYDHIEDLSTLPLRPRLAKQLVRLGRRYGVPAQAQDVRIGLPLVQEELAQMLAASRQRVNYELKNLERQDLIRIERSGAMVIRDGAALREVAAGWI